MSVMMFWPGVIRSSFSTLSAVTNQDFLYVDEVILPWHQLGFDIR